MLLPPYGWAGAALVRLLQLQQQQLVQSADRKPPAAARPSSHQARSPQVEHILAGQREQSLLAGWQPQHQQQHHHHLVTRQQPLGGRLFAASAAAAAAAAASGAPDNSRPAPEHPSGTAGGSSSSHSRAQATAWRHAVPPLHQPSQHVSGTDPMQALRAAQALTAAAAAAAAAAAPAGSAQAAAAVADSTAPSAGLRRVVAAVRALPWGVAAWRLMQLSVGVTTAVAVFVVVKVVALASTPGTLHSNDGRVQQRGLSRLRQLLLVSRAGLGSELAADMVSQGVMRALLALVRPDAGTDTLVLVDALELLRELLEFDATRQAMQQAGLAEQLSQGLRSGQTPKGAQAAAAALRDALLRQPPAAAAAT